MFSIKETYVRHFKNNIFIYFLITVVLMIGISAGVITIKILGESQRTQLHSFLSEFFSNIDSQEVNNISLLKYSITNNFKTIFIIWIMGLIIIGIPISLGIILFRGFTIGFSIGFMINDFGFKGLLLTILTLIPQNIFILPGLIIISSISISYSINFIKGRRKNKKHNIFKEATLYTLYILITCICFVIGGIVESYITPYLMKLIL